MNKLRILINKDFHQIKNYFKAFNKNRKKLIPVAFYILWFYFMFKSQTDSNFYSINYFKNFSFGILTFLLIISLINIYFERTSYFNMADVNLLFTAPIDSKLVLIYAIFKTSWKQMLAALFMFMFLSPSLMNAGIHFPHLLIGVLAYALFIFAIEPISFIIAQLGKKYDLKFIISTLVIVLLMMIAIPMILLKSPIEGIQSEYMNFVPLIGWSRGIFMGMFQINGYFFLYTTLMVLFILVINLYIIKTSEHYYEDVIAATEDLNLRPARILINRFRSHKLYKRVAQQAIVSNNGKDIDIPWQRRLWDMEESKITEEIVKWSSLKSSKTCSIDLSEDDVVVEKRKIHHGMGEENRKQKTLEF
jgi:hypothetical protein